MYDKKVEEIVNLKRKLEDTNKNHNTILESLQNNLKLLKDTNNELKRTISGLESYKFKTKEFEDQLASKSNYITILENNLNEKDKQIEIIKLKSDQKSSEQYKLGKEDALASMLNIYRDQPFDVLIKSSTKKSVARDMQFVGNNTDIMMVLKGLQIYFDAQVLLSEKFDAVKISEAQMKLGQVKHQSKLLDGLKDDIDSYNDFNTALKETIQKVVNLDKIKSVDGDSGIQQSKFNDIVAILTDYMYNYYNYASYPYLSDKVLEIIKRKQPNADADISDLLLIL
jgi:hypothetical protein